MLDLTWYESCGGLETSAWGTCGTPKKQEAES